MIPKQEVYKRALEQILIDHKDRRVILQKIKELNDRKTDDLFIGKKGSKLREIEEYANSLEIENKEETVGDPEYNPYCTVCSQSCGENSCCDYKDCVFTAIDNNEGCFYPETYKREILIRDYFMEECFKQEDSMIGLKEFFDRVYDSAFDKAEKYFKDK
jgi:hypothetical protein